MSIDNSLPRRIVVSHVLSGRYPPGSRPVSWDERREAIETVTATDGQTLRLYSNGGQSTPSENWELLLTSENHDADGPAYSWTLYGLPGKS